MREFEAKRGAAADEPSNRARGAEYDESGDESDVKEKDTHKVGPCPLGEVA